jgi:dimethylglycine dehydrogenase
MGSNPSGSACAVREGVGINEVQNFGKYRVSGPNAREWLDHIMAGLIPKPGRLSLTPMLAHSGKIIGDFTVSCLSETEFQLTASYGAQGWHPLVRDEPDGRRPVENISDARSGFQIAGPKARELLSRVTRSDVSPKPSSSWTSAA